MAAAGFLAHPRTEAAGCLPQCCICSRRGVSWAAPHSPGAGAPVCREQNDGLYTPLTYLVYKQIEEIFVCTITTLIASESPPCRIRGIC